VISADDVRLVLSFLSTLPPDRTFYDVTYPQTMFHDLVEIWASHWTADDFRTIFEIFKRSRRFEEAWFTMKSIYETKNVIRYPERDCWNRLLDSLAGNRDYMAFRKCKEVWRMMDSYDVKPDLATFNSLFGVLCKLPEAFEFLVSLYRDHFLNSPTTKPDYATLRSLLEAHMTQSTDQTNIAEGDFFFEQILRFKSSMSHDSGFWDLIVKWMLFRGDSLRLIKHTLYEEKAAISRTTANGTTNAHKPLTDTRGTPSITSTLDQLMDVALQTGKIGAARTIYEEFFPSFDITPTVETDKLRIETLIRAGESDAAKALYDDLKYQGHRLPPDLMMKLLQSLAQSHHPLTFDAQSIFFDLLDYRDCNPEMYTVAFSMLVSSLLRSDDYPRLRQTIQDRSIGRVPHWRTTLSRLCLDLLSDPKTVYLEPLLPVYHIVQRWTPETITLADRHNLMHKLLVNGRTDLGLELFHDMRNSNVSQPTRETYAIMFTGCAKTRDAQTLEHVHAALRLDSSVEPDSKLFNSLMLAYNRSQLPEKALAIWEVLSQSSRLPDAETASLALDACVRLPRYGLIRAREIWSFMEDNHIEPVSSSYASLLAVFASVGKWDAMIGLLERIDRDHVNARVLGTAYNCMRRDRKFEVEQWARSNKPDVWRYLEQLG
jgi:hypothetical protein